MPHIKFIILASALLLFWLVLSYIVPIKPNEVVGASPLDRADVANSNQGVLSEK